MFSNNRTNMFIGTISFFLLAHSLFGKAKDEISISEEHFNEAIDKILLVYVSEIEKLGITPEVIRKYGDNSVSTDHGDRVTINTRLFNTPEMDADVFTLYACSLFNKFIVFYPKVRSDIPVNSKIYQAVHGCLKRVWKDEKDINEKYRKKVKPYINERCSENYKNRENENLCMRISNAGYNFSRVRGKGKVIPNRPDPKVAKKTNAWIVSYQCFFDTIFAASLCSKNPSEKEITLLDNYDTFKQTYCLEGGYLKGAPPKCWYNPKNF